MTWQKRRGRSCSRMERKTLMRRGKRFARQRERYETAEAALAPEAPGESVRGEWKQCSRVHRAAFPRLTIALRTLKGKDELPISYVSGLSSAHRLSARSR